MGQGKEKDMWGERRDDGSGAGGQDLPDLCRNVLEALNLIPGIAPLKLRLGLKVVKLFAQLLVPLALLLQLFLVSRIGESAIGCRS
jgi:hypothetical protein